MEKENVKEQNGKTKTAIKVATGVIVGALIGGAAVQYKNRDAIKLAKLIGGPSFENDGSSLVKIVIDWASRGNAVYDSVPDNATKLNEIGGAFDSLVNYAAKYGRDSDEVIGSVIFTKKTK